MDTSNLSPLNWFRKEESTDSYMNPVLTPGNHGLDLYGGPMSTAMEHVFDDPIRRSHERLTRGKGSQIATTLPKPDVDVTGDGTQYMVTVELPGVEDKDIQVELLETTRSASVAKEAGGRKKGKGYYRMERSYGSFRRILTLPADAEITGATACHKDGVLTITFPRKPVAPSNNRSIELTKR